MSFCCRERINKSSKETCYTILADAFEWNQDTFTGIGLDNIPVPDISKETIDKCNDIDLLMKQLHVNGTSVTLTCSLCLSIQLCSFHLCSFHLCSFHLCSFHLCSFHF
jgi:hypothetical protein